MSKAKDASKRKYSRHPIRFDYDKVERLAGLGLSREGIATALGCSVRTVFNRLNQDPEFAAAFEKGRISREVFVANKLMEKCNDGNIPAIKFYLTSVAGWRNNKDITLAGDIKAKSSLDIKALDTGELLAMLEQLEGHKVTIS